MLLLTPGERFIGGLEGLPEKLPKERTVNGHPYNTGLVIDDRGEIQIYYPDVSRK
jgi:hypothetical protein